MSYKVITSKRFEKSLKRCARRGLDLRKISEAIGILAKEGSLPAAYRPHKLSGKYNYVFRFPFSVFRITNSAISQ